MTFFYWCARIVAFGGVLLMAVGLGIDVGKDPARIWTVLTTVALVALIREYRNLVEEGEP